MTVVRFGEWSPDLAPLGNPGILVATNCLPAADGYLPRRELVAVTDALPSRPLGAIQALDQTRNVYQYAGTGPDLWQNVGGVWTNRSKPGGYVTGTEERWEFVFWKNKVLGTNYADPPQQILLGTEPFSDLTTDFRARHLAVIRDFVVGANTTDPVDDEVTSRVRWSAINDETDWTVSPITLADFQDLKSAEILRILGGEYGVVAQRSAMWRMTFVGAPVVFQFDEVLQGVGIIAPGAAVRDADSVYFLSDQGFFQLVQGTTARPIGNNRVDSTVLGEIDADHLHRITSDADPTSQTLWFAYAGPGNVNGTPNRVAVYNRAIDRWSVQDLETELLWRAGSTGLTLEQLDTISTSIDDLPASLDSQRWLGGAPVLAAFDSSYQSGFFTGDKATALIETGEMEIHSGRRTALNAWRPVVDGGTVRSRVSTRSRQVDPVVVGEWRDQSASGRFTERANARYHRFGFEISGDWDHALGVEIDARGAPRGAYRG